MLWLFWLILMVLIAAAPGIYMVVEQHRNISAQRNLQHVDSPVTLPK